jgi:hypothetical protein
VTEPVKVPPVREPPTPKSPYRARTLGRSDRSRINPPRAWDLLAVHGDDHSAAPYLRAGNGIIAAASMPAGILTICSWSPTPRIWHSSARHIASGGTRCLVRTSGSTPGQGHESAGHAFGRTNGGFGQRWAEPKPAIQAPPDKPANPVARLVDLVPSSSSLSTARSWGDATQSWEPAGCSPGQLTPMGGLVKAPSGSSWTPAVRYQPTDRPKDRCADLP